MALLFRKEFVSSVKGSKRKEFAPFSLLSVDHIDMEGKNVNDTVVSPASITISLKEIYLKKKQKKKKTVHTLIRLLLQKHWIVFSSINFYSRKILYFPFHQSCFNIRWRRLCHIHVNAVSQMSDEDSACFYMNFTEFITLSAPVTKTTEFTKKK